jgi:hypothetical protein
MRGLRQEAVEGNPLAYSVMCRAERRADNQDHPLWAENRIRTVLLRRIRLLRVLQLLRAFPLILGATRLCLGLSLLDMPLRPRQGRVLGLSMTHIRSNSSRHSSRRGNGETEKDGWSRRARRGQSFIWMEGDIGNLEPPRGHQRRLLIRRNAISIYLYIYGHCDSVFFSLLSLTLGKDFQQEKRRIGSCACTYDLITFIAWCFELLLS